MRNMKIPRKYALSCMKFSAMVLLALILSLVPDHHAKAAIGKGQITADQVNLRSDAGVSFSKVTSLPIGLVTDIDGVKADSSGKYWYKVSFQSEGKKVEGYVLGDYVKYSASEEKTDGASSDTSGKKKKKKKKKASDKGQTQTTEVEVSVDIAMPADEDQTEALNVSVGNSASSEDGTEGNTAGDAAADASVTDTSGQEKKLTKGTKLKITAANVRIRKKPVTGEAFVTLKNGKKLKYLKQKKGKDGYIWYKVSFKYSGMTMKGFVRSDLVAVRDTAVKQAGEETSDEQAPVSEESAAMAAMSSEEFEDYLTEQGFPASYKDGLRTIHAAHPGWVLKAVNTGLDWNDVMTNESKVGLNLVSKGSISSWKSTAVAAYNWKKNIWYTFDGGSWVAASEALIAYFMDPRNFLTEQQIFQFETLEYRDYQTVAGVRKLLEGTFMAGDYTDSDGSVRSYADTFVSVGKSVGVSPYHLAARCYQEQGSGRSDSVSGRVPGYENIYNYFNIGAYAQGKNSPTKQGLIYASSSVAGTANYARPWNSRYQSILGGGTYLSERYVKCGQSTLYFQKFNVVNSKNGLYKHQYMANIQAASSEAVRLSRAAGSDPGACFYIPVYSNMPDQACAKPVADMNPNNYLSSLSVAGKKISPAFDGSNQSYTLTVKKKVKKVNIQAAAVSGSAVIEGIGEVSLERGENVFEIICRAQTGDERIYTLVITRK